MRLGFLEFDELSMMWPCTSMMIMLYSRLVLLWCDDVYLWRFNCTYVTLFHNYVVSGVTSRTLASFAIMCSSSRKLGQACMNPRPHWKLTENAEKMILEEVWFMLNFCPKLWWYRQYRWQLHSSAVLINQLWSPDNKHCSNLPPFMHLQQIHPAYSLSLRWS